MAGPPLGRRLEVWTPPELLPRVQIITCGVLPESCLAGTAASAADLSRVQAEDPRGALRAAERDDRDVALHVHQGLQAHGHEHRRSLPGDGGQVHGPGAARHGQCNSRESSRRVGFIFGYRSLEGRGGVGLHDVRRRLSLTPCYRQGPWRTLVCIFCTFSSLFVYHLPILMIMAYTPCIKLFVHISPEVPIRILEATGTLMVDSDSPGRRHMTVV